MLSWNSDGKLPQTLDFILAGMTMTSVWWWWRGWLRWWRWWLRWCNWDDGNDNSKRQPPASQPVRQNSDGKLPQGLNSITGQGNTDEKENEKMELFVKLKESYNLYKCKCTKRHWVVCGRCNVISAKSLKLETSMAYYARERTIEGTFQDIFPK